MTEQDSGKLYRGVVVPMVTPVTADRKLDEPAVRRIIDHLIDGGSNGIFVLGTTGEAASISPRVGHRLVELAVEQVGNRATTYAGISQNCLNDSVAAAEAYFRLGVHAVVAHLPFYYPLDGKEQRDYYTVLADRLGGPLMIYNIPKTTHLSIPIEVIEQLSHHPNIVGVKDSELDLGRLKALMAAVGNRTDFSVLVGVSSLAHDAMRLGADGIVPSPAHLAPESCSGLYACGCAGDTENMPAYQALINEVSAICNRGRSLGQSLAALKAAMSELDLCGPDMLYPLQALPREEQEAVRRAYRDWRSSVMA